MRRVAVFLSIVCGLLAAVMSYGAIRKTPASSQCLKYSVYDANQDGTIDACPPPDAWVLSGGAYTADVSAGLYDVPTTLITDNLSPTGHYLVTPSSSLGIDATPVMAYCNQTWPTTGTFVVSFITATPN